MKIASAERNGGMKRHNGFWRIISCDWACMGVGVWYVWKHRLWTDCDEPGMPSVLLENICFPCAGQSDNHFHTYCMMGLPVTYAWNQFASKGTFQWDDTWKVKSVGIRTMFSNLLPEHISDFSTISSSCYKGQRVFHPLHFCTCMFPHPPLGHTPCSLRNGSRKLG